MSDEANLIQDVSNVDSISSRVDLAMKSQWYPLKNITKMLKEWDLTSALMCTDHIDLEANNKGLTELSLEVDEVFKWLLQEGKLSLIWEFFTSFVFAKSLMLKHLEEKIDDYIVKRNPYRMEALLKITSGHCKKINIDTHRSRLVMESIIFSIANNEMDCALATRRLFNLELSNFRQPLFLNTINEWYSICSKRGDQIQKLLIKDSFWVLL